MSLAIQIFGIVCLVLFVVFFFAMLIGAWDEEQLDAD